MDFQELLESAPQFVKWAEDNGVDLTPEDDFVLFLLNCWLTAQLRATENLQ